MSNNDFNDSADKKRHDKNRAVSDKNFVKSAWDGNKRLVEFLNSIGGLSVDGYDVGVLVAVCSARISDTAAAYQPPCVQATISVSKKSILPTATKREVQISLDVDGVYKIESKLPTVSDKTSVQNRVVNAIQTWVVGIGNEFNQDFLGAAMQRRADQAEAQAARRQSRERNPKPA